MCARFRNTFYSAIITYHSNSQHIITILEHAKITIIGHNYSTLGPGPVSTGYGDGMRSPFFRPALSRAERTSSSLNVSGSWKENQYSPDMPRCSIYPRPSMYGIFTYIYPIKDPNVGKYTIHGSSGYGRFTVAYHENGPVL